MLLLLSQKQATDLAFAADIIRREYRFTGKVTVVPDMGTIGQVKAWLTPSRLQWLQAISGGYVITSNSVLASHLSGLKATKAVARPLSSPLWPGLHVSYVTHLLGKDGNPQLKFALYSAMLQIGRHKHQTNMAPVQQYPLNYSELNQYPELACDIETTGLTLGSEVLSISFSPNVSTAYVGVPVKKEIKKFLEAYQGQLIFHNALFDVKLLLWWLYVDTTMTNEQRMARLIRATQTFPPLHDTMLLVYLRYNNPTRTIKGLKHNALPFAGAYAMDIDQASFTSVTPELLAYNAEDTTATWWLWDLHRHIAQTEPYQIIFQPSLKMLLKVMLVGIPINHEKASQAYIELQRESNAIGQALQKNGCHNRYIKATGSPLDINSTKQLAKLIHDIEQEPVAGLTASNQPTMTEAALIKIKESTQSDELRELISLVLKHRNTTKLRETFIKPLRACGSVLHGSFHLGGTQSGRLSSSEPNLTNLPAHGSSGKMVKSLIEAPSGWLIAGADFSSLEERVGAILTNDPERIKVYTQGYDAHCLRAFAYFGESMPDIAQEMDNATTEDQKVKIINSIKSRYPNLRQEGKTPTFALQYAGTEMTLIHQQGFTPERARQIVTQYKQLYAVTEAWNYQNTLKVIEQGYVECAFGLRLHVPSLKGASPNNLTKHQAALVRSMNNSITQSWNMLLQRAVIAIQKDIEASPYADSIFCINLIHDANYWLVKRNKSTVDFLHQTLLKHMTWNDHPKIQHNEVLMLAEMEIGSSWANLQPVESYYNENFIPD